MRNGDKSSDDRRFKFQVQSLELGIDGFQRLLFTAHRFTVYDFHDFYGFCDALVDLTWLENLGFYSRIKNDKIFLTFLDLAIRCDILLYPTSQV